MVGRVGGDRELGKILDKYFSYKMNKFGVLRYSMVMKVNH